MGLVRGNPLARGVGQHRGERHRAVIPGLLSLYLLFKNRMWLCSKGSTARPGR
jgi:hypothetical protein